MSRSFGLSLNGRMTVAITSVERCGSPPIGGRVRIARSAPSAGRNGYSYIEMIMVVLIAGILTTIAAPRLSSSVHQFRVLNAARRISADLDRARVSAANSGLAKVVTFSTSESRYEISGLVPLNGTVGIYSVNLLVDPFQSRLVNVWGQTGTQSLTFDGYGVPNRGGTISVSSGTAQKTIAVDATTGKAVIQ